MTIFTLPLPPPLNQLYRIANNHMYKTAEARCWESEAGWEIKKVWKGTKELQDKVKVSVIIYYKFDRDIDSSFKVLFDVLQTQNVIKNDMKITNLRCVKIKDVQNPRIKVEVQAV